MSRPLGAHWLQKEVSEKWLREMSVIVSFNEPFVAFIAISWPLCHLEEKRQ